MIEFVFSASLETIRRSLRSSKLLRPVRHSRDLAACASMNPDVLFFPLSGKVFTLLRSV